MSKEQNRKGFYDIFGGNNFLIAACAGVFCFILACAVAIFIAAPEGANTGSIISLLFGSGASFIASLVAINSVRGVDKKVDRVLNGEMEGKLQRVLERHDDNS